MNGQLFPARRTLLLAGVLGLVVAVGCGLLNQGGQAITDRPPTLVVWGDPASDSEGTTIRDVNDLEDRFVVVGTDGHVQFSDGSVCNDCRVDGATILIDEVARMYIRFGTGPGTGTVRRPYLVSTDGYYIELVGTDDGITFQEEDLRFEEPDDATDDLAQAVGTTTNPKAPQSRQAPLCGNAVAVFAPLTAVGMLGLAQVRRRRLR